MTLLQALVALAVFEILTLVGLFVAVCFPPDLHQPPKPPNPWSPERAAPPGREAAGGGAPSPGGRESDGRGGQGVRSCQEVPHVP